MPRERSATSRSPSSASTVSRSTPASVAISRRVSGRSATNSSASSWSTLRLPGRRWRCSAARLGCSSSTWAGPGPTATSCSSVTAFTFADRCGRLAVAARPVRGRTLIGPHGSSCSMVTSRPLASSSSARNVTAMTIRSWTSRSSSWSTSCGAARRARRMTAARSSSVIVRATVCGGGCGGGTSRTDAASASASSCGSSFSPVSGRAPAVPAAAATRRLAVEERHEPGQPIRRARGRRRGTCGTRSGAGAALPRDRPRPPRRSVRRGAGRPRQDRARLDQDELRAHGDERAEQRQPALARCAPARPGTRRPDRPVERSGRRAGAAR